MIIKCYNEEVKASNKNCKVNGSAVCFLYNIFFLCYFYSRSLCCFNQSLHCFLRENVIENQCDRKVTFLHDTTYCGDIFQVKWANLYSRLVWSFPRSPFTINYRHRFIFDRVVPKTKEWHFLGHSVDMIVDHTQDWQTTDCSSCYRS